MPRTISAVRGFTVVELVTSIVIMGILAAVIAPKFFDSNTFSARGYADEVAAALRYAENVAVSSGCAVAVTVNATGYQAMQHAVGPPNCAGAWSVPVISVDGSNVSGAPPAGASIAPVTQIIFDTQGHLQSGAASLQVGGFTLTINRFSGLVVRQ